MVDDSEASSGALEPAEPAGFGAVFEAVKTFDWLHIPGATRSIARLVGSFGEAGAAWVSIATVKAKQIQSIIADDTAAKTALSQALAKKAAKAAVADSDLVQLHVEAWAGERVRKQENKASVALMTLEQLKADPPPDNAEGPDEDWINVFEGYAEKANSERLRLIWSKVLAGEIRKAGSFSYKTLEFVALLDQNIAGSLQAISKTVIQYSFIVDPDRFNYTLEFNHILALQEYGLLSDVKSRRLSFDSSGGFLMQVDKTLGILLTGDSNQIVEVQTYLLTRVGREIMQIVDANHTIDSISEEAKRFATNDT